MLVDLDSVAKAVQYAQKIARKMSKDPEVDSIAGEAAWRALYTYDIKRNVKLSWWVAQLTKQAVVQYWRRMSRLREHEKLMDELWWAEQTPVGRLPGKDLPVHSSDDNLRHRLSQDEEELATNPVDWQLLVEIFVLKWPLDVIARERSISLGEARRRKMAAIARLEAAC